MPTTDYFDQSRMLRRATDFWREALVPLVTENHQIAKNFSGRLHKAAQHTDAITKGHANRNMPHTLFNSVQGFKWFEAFIQFRARLQMV
jgi:hypothetical protein